MEALPTRRPHLPQQPEQIVRLRTHLCGMANEARAEEDRAEIWEMATHTCGEPELQVLKDVHWKALTVLDKLHKRERRARKKAIADYSREASRGAAGLLHRLTKPRPVWSPRDAAQGEADRLWESPNGDDMSALPQLEVEELSGFDAVVGSFKAKTGIGVDAIHPSVWSRISVKGKQLYTDLLNDVERTLTWPAQIQTLIYFLVPKTPTGATHRTHAINRASVGTDAQAHSGSMDDFPDPVL